MTTISPAYHSVSFQGKQNNEEGKLKTSVKKLFTRPSKEEIEQRKAEKKAENKVMQKASLAGLKAAAITTPLSVLSLLSLSKYNNSITSKEVSVLENAADNYIKNSKLKDVVKLNRIETVKPSAKQLVSSLANPCGMKEQIKYGLNACFNNVTGEITMPKGKLALASFHEMGHALNFNFSKIGKSLQKMRLPLLAGTSILSMFAFSVATSKNSKKGKARKEDAKVDKKVQDNQKENRESKFRKFAKKAMVVLPPVLMAPIVGEEALASYKGNNIAKEVLKDTPKLAKKVKISNAIGLASYILSGLVLSYTAHSVIKAADKEKERQSQQAKEA